MTHDVAYGPVGMPGDNGKIDARAWEALQSIGCQPADYMLMHYEPSGMYGRLCAAFKHRDRRLYRRLTFNFTKRDADTREAQAEPERDVIAQRRFIAECEKVGVRSDGLRDGLKVLEARLSGGKAVA